MIWQIFPGYITPIVRMNKKGVDTQLKLTLCQHILIIQ